MDLRLEEAECCNVLKDNINFKVHFKRKKLLIFCCFILIEGFLENIPKLCIKIW